MPRLIVLLLLCLAFSQPLLAEKKVLSPGGASSKLTYSPLVHVNVEDQVKQSLSCNGGIEIESSPAIAGYVIAYGAQFTETSQRAKSISDKLKAVAEKYSGTVSLSEPFRGFANSNSGKGNEAAGPIVVALPVLVELKATTERIDELLDELRNEGLVRFGFIESMNDINNQWGAGQAVVWKASLSRADGKKFIRDCVKSKIEMICAQAHGYMSYGSKSVESKEDGAESELTKKRSQECEDTEKLADKVLTSISNGQLSIYPDSGVTVLFPRSGANNIVLDFSTDKKGSLWEVYLAREVNSINVSFYRR